MASDRMMRAGGCRAISPFLILSPIVVFYLLSSIKILNEYERAVVFRLGKLLDAPKGPGVILVFAPIDRMVRVSLRTIVMDVPPQDVITRDNVSVKVNAVVYFRVMDPRRAIVEVESYHYATSQLAQTTLRSVLGQVELDDLLSERERLNQQLQQILDQHTDPWGIKVSSVEVKHVDLPPDMQRAMAKQAEAEREKRAKIIHAAGELEASEKLAAAATVMSVEPMTITLRYLQTLTEIASEKNSTIIFPLPIELMNLMTGREQGVSVSELTHDTADDGFHEIQLSGKQLVFLFIVTTTVIVVVFLCGVKVGRGARDGAGGGARADCRDGRPRPQPAPAAAPPATEPPAPAAESADELSVSRTAQGEGTGGKPLKRSSSRRRNRRRRAQNQSRLRQRRASPARRRQGGRPSAPADTSPTAGRPGTLGRSGHCHARSRHGELVSSSGSRQGLSGLSRRIRPADAAPRITRCTSAGTPIAARRSRCRCASRRKNSSSPGLRASDPLGRAARTQLPEIRPSRHARGWR